jgi:hypothetical protein
MPKNQQDRQIGAKVMAKHDKKPRTSMRVLPSPAPARPELTAAEIAALSARFDAKKWDATADADQAAEVAARTPKKKRVAYA